jgi:hypothetical protein
MNTTKIAAFYTPYVAHLLSIPTAESHQELRRILLMKREDTSLASDWEIRIRHYAPDSHKLEQRCSRRVYEWAIKQLPATDHKQLEGEVWSAMTADFSTKPAGFLLRYSGEEDFATLLRGMQHYQRKLDRQTRKLLAQLQAYHYLGQIPAVAVTTTPAEPVGVAQPTSGVVPRFYAGLRRRLAAKIHQVAVAAEAIVLGEGGQLV